MSRDFRSKAPIDPSAKNPLYPEAVRLVDATAGRQFISFDVRRGGFFLVTTLSTAWREVEEPIVNADDRTIAYVDNIIAYDIHGNPIRLTARGLHPYLGEALDWNAHRFSVPAEKESVIKFNFWLEKQGFARAANEVQSTFFDFFAGGDFWKELTRQG